jgi:alkyl sulfatase BDS1-like metallo-beta-lactamase superfamily hydrolase
MPFFASSDQLYQCFKALIARIEAEHADATAAMLKSGLSFRFRFSEPEAELTIDARQRPLQIVYGPSSQKADLQVVLTADTLHAILLGNLSLKKAIGSRQVVPKGPVWKTTVLSDLFTQAQTIYPDLLREMEL